MSAPKPKHSISWHKQFMIDIRPWLAGMVVTVLTAAVVTLVGLLLTVDGGYRVTGPLVILVGLVAVVFVSAFWAAGRVVPGNGVAA